MEYSLYRNLAARVRGVPVYVHILHRNREGLTSGVDHMSSHREKREHLIWQMQILEQVHQAAGECQIENSEIPESLQGAFSDEPAPVLKIWNDGMAWSIGLGSNGVFIGFTLPGGNQLTRCTWSFDSTSWTNMAASRKVALLNSIQRSNNNGNEALLLGDIGRLIASRVNYYLRQNEPYSI